MQTKEISIISRMYGKGRGRAPTQIIFGTMPSRKAIDILLLRNNKK